MGGQEHFYMETHSALVIPKGEDQEMDVYVSTQFPKFVQVLQSYYFMVNGFYQQNLPRAIRDKSIISLETEKILSTK